MTPYEGPDRRGQNEVIIMLSELKSEVIDRLARIETIQEGTNTRLDRHSDSLMKHNTILLGDGEKVKGVAGRIDHLESHNARVTTGITFGIIAAWELVKRKVLGE